MTAETACTLIPQQLTNSPAEPTVSDLVARAKDGDRQAWDALVERYAPLIWSICRRHRLGRADADDVAQSVWLRLVDQLDRVRDPAALPGYPAIDILQLDQVLRPDSLTVGALRVYRRRAIAPSSTARQNFARR